MASFSPFTQSAQADPPRRTLLEVHQRLTALYSALIVAEQATYERIHGRVASSDELIQLLLNDPWFTWLRPVLDLLLRIELLLEDNAFDITHDNMEHLVAEVRNLTRPSIEGDGFERAYYEALNRAPDVVLAHFHVTRALQTDAA
ncbi:MAG: hypothetical protein HXY51_04040 [Nitrospirae bacterium]|nr:hypothetical protein [Nitrospirota bacterium]